MSEKKKLSKFGKVWIIVCVAAVVLGLLLTFIGPILDGMNRYNNHEHEEWCYYYNWDNTVRYLDCSYGYYNDAFSYAMGYGDGAMWLVFFVGGCLVIANVVMGIIYASRKAKAANPQTEQAAPVSIPMGEGEQAVLERHYPSAFPIVLMVLGVLEALSGIISIVNSDEEIGIPLLIVGAIFLVMGFILSKILMIHLVVTTKRVYLKAPFAARLNLPLRRISAVGTGLFHYLTITSAAGFAGQIRLFFVPKYLEVYDTINALLNEVE